MEIDLDTGKLVATSTSRIRWTAGWHVCWSPPRFHAAGKAAKRAEHAGRAAEKAAEHGGKAAQHKAGEAVEHGGRAQPGVSSMVSWPRTVASNWSTTRPASGALEVYRVCVHKEPRRSLLWGWYKHPRDTCVDNEVVPLYRR